MNTRDDNNPPWLDAPTMTLDWSAPVETRYSAIPPEAIERSAVLLETLRARAPRAVRWLADLVRVRTRGRFHAEALALANAAGVDWREIMVANLAYDLTLATIGCSTIALATPSGPVLARNMDWWPEHVLARTSMLVEARRGRDRVLANAGWPGAIGVVSGLSGRGFAVVLNAVRAPGGADWLGYPVLLHIRRVLEDAATFDEAVDRLARPRLASGCLLTVVGMENPQRVVIERTPRRHAIRRPTGDEPILATNHYRCRVPRVSESEVTANALTCTRYEALRALYHDHDGSTDVSDARLLYALTDPRVRQDITAQHVVIRPRVGTIRLLVPRRLLDEADAAQ